MSTSDTHTHTMPDVSMKLEHIRHYLALADVQHGQLHGLAHDEESVDISDRLGWLLADVFNMLVEVQNTLYPDGRTATAHTTGQISASHEARMQQLVDDVANVSKPEPIYFGTLDLNKLIPDISLNLSHLRALLSSAYQQIEKAHTPQQQVNAACWLIRDALKELSAIEETYYGEPDTSE